MGIPVDDRQHLGTRYATSKITSVEDILTVKTYGFRGEALASLCVISSLSLTTRVPGEQCAKLLDFDHNGNITTYPTSGICDYRADRCRTRPSSGEIGTFVVIRNLFKELPVRLAEAKKRKIPVSKVKSLISSYAFVRNVRFVLKYRGNKRIDWSVLGGNPIDVAVSVFGRDVMRGYRHVTWQDENISIEGIVPPLNEGIPERNLCKFLAVDCVRWTDGSYASGQILTISFLLR